jgi:ATP adenylyltransferase
MPEPRFRRIMTGACPALLHDTLLWDLGDLVVTPTLGSIVPHWVLIIPKARVLNIAMWSAADSSAPLHYVNEVARRAGRSADDIIWFEHGPAVAKGVTGCGVDHAHMHVLLAPAFTFEQFKSASRDAASYLKWHEGVGNPYASITSNKSYLVAGGGRQFLFASTVEAAGSQFFRRVIATLSGNPVSWNYKKHPHLNNVALTVEAAREAA